MDPIRNTTDFNTALATAINNKDLDALCHIHYRTGSDNWPTQEWVQTKEERAAQISLLQAAYNIIDGTTLPERLAKVTSPRRSCGECGDPMTKVVGGYRCNSAHCCPTIGSDC